MSNSVLTQHVEPGPEFWHDDGVSTWSLDLSLIDDAKHGRDINCNALGSGTRSWERGMCFELALMCDAGANYCPKLFAFGRQA